MGAPSVTVNCGYCGATGEGPLRSFQVAKGGRVLSRTVIDSPPGWGRRGDRAARQVKDVCPECRAKLASGELKS